MSASAAKRVDAIKAPSFSELFEAKQAYTNRTGQEVIDFSIGSSNIPPAKEVKDALAAAVMEDDSFQYSLAPLTEMVKAIQDWYKRRYGVDLKEDEIFTLKGSQEALSHLPMAFCDKGDIVLLPDPYYPIYGTAPLLADADVVFLPLKKENDYLMDLDAVDPETARKVKMMVVSYPSNPTGATAPDSFYEKLIRFAKDNDILIVHDNAYSELIYDGPAGKSFLSYDGAKDVGIELNSFSKSWSMGGARMAVMVGNKDMIDVYKKLINTIDFGVFPAVQKAAIAALEQCPDFPKTVCKEYKRRRDYLIDQFDQAGWKIEPNKATMFVWAPIPDHYEDSSAFASDLLNEAGVLVNAGTSFGNEGKRFVRLALVRDDDQVSEAARRIAQSGILNKQ